MSGTYASQKPGPPPKGPPPKDPPSKEPPLKKTDVKVKVEPKSGDDAKSSKENRDLAKEVERKVTEQVKKAVEKNKDAGESQTVKEVKKEADTAKKSVDPQRVEKIDVTVEGEDAKGDRFTFKKTVKPSGDG